MAKSTFCFNFRLFLCVINPRLRYSSNILEKHCVLCQKSQRCRKEGLRSATLATPFLSDLQDEDACIDLSAQVELNTIHHL